MGLSLLAHASRPIKLWDEAFLNATYLINRMPTRVIDNKSPIERLFKTPPNYSMLKIFGCACWAHLRPYNKHNLSFRSKLYVFLGYSALHKGYKCLDINTGRIYMSRDVVFDETIFPFVNHSPNHSDYSPGSSVFRSFDQMLLPANPVDAAHPVYVPAEWISGSTAAEESVSDSTQADASAMSSSELGGATNDVVPPHGDIQTVSQDPVLPTPQSSCRASAPSSCSACAPRIWSDSICWTGIRHKSKPWHRTAQDSDRWHCFIWWIGCARCVRAYLSTICSLRSSMAWSNEPGVWGFGPQQNMAFGQSETRVKRHRLQVGVEN